MDDDHGVRRAILFYGGFSSRSGGAFMHARTLSEGLRAKGWSVVTVTLDRLPLVVRYLPHAVGALVNALIPPLGFYYKGIVTRVLYKHLVRHRSSDLLIFEDVYLGWNSRNPSISMLHAVWSDNLQSYSLTDKAIERLKAKEAASIRKIAHPVVTVSEPYRNFLRKEHFRGFGEIDLKVVELGLNMRKVHVQPAQTRAGPARSLIYCGTLEARKNVYFMLEVFGRILAEDPEAALTIVGDGPDRKGLEQHAGRHGMNVTFLGRLPHEQVLAELGNHNIYIHTALKESFSFALLEAKLAGLTTCALASLEVPEEFIDLGFDGFEAAEWSTRILAIDGKPDLSDFPDYSIGRMTDRTLALVSMR